MEDRKRNAECGMRNEEELSQDDELLLQQFFAEHAVEVPDNGFSKAVMRRLPQRARQMNNIWSAVCCVAGLVLFLLFDGVAAVRAVIINLLGNVWGFLVSVNLMSILQQINFSALLMVAVSMVVILIVALYNQLEA